MTKAKAALLPPLAYDDDHCAAGRIERLWQTVLSVVVAEALRGEDLQGTPRERVHDIKAARYYLTVPNRDFDTVCSLAGLDPDAVRDRMVKMIKEAPSPEEIVEQWLADLNRKRATTFTLRRNRQLIRRISALVRAPPTVFEQSHT
jgi:hypothetical protein